jgi:hypothetical protein
MKQLVSGKSRAGLRAWINAPKTIRPTTTMPALSTKLDNKKRARIIDQIVDYLEAL